nr:AlpA family phage regulatory protein [Azonexus hydrophilus]
MDEMKKPGRVLIDRSRLHEIVPLSERTIFDMEKRGEFPQRFTLSARRVAWDLAEVEAWIEERQSGGGKASFPKPRNAEL